MNDNSTTYIFYWTLYIGLIPFVLSLISITIGKFLTVKNKKVTFPQALRFAICMLLITVSYFFISFLLNSSINKQYSDRLSKDKDNIAFGVYQNSELPNTKKLVAQYVSTLRKPSSPPATFYDTASPYLIQEFGGSDGIYTLGGFTVRQFNPAKYILTDKDCGPIDPEFPDKVDKGNCKLVAKNPEGKSIYAMYAKVHRWPGDVGPDKYVPTNLITTYGNTRISLTSNANSSPIEERIKIMQSFREVPLKDIRYFNPNLYKQTFWMPSLY